MAISYPNKLELAQLPTPLRCLNRISAELGGPRIWMKCDDLTGTTLSGNKIRKLEYVVAAALENGADTLITCGGLQSNHCRATAIVGAQLGLRVHLILRGDASSSASASKSENAPDGNHFLDSFFGAAISVYPPDEYFSKLPELFNTWSDFYAQKGHKSHCIPTGASDEIGIWGYISAVPELQNDFTKANISPDAIVCATGSSGTQAGLTLGCHLYGVSSPVFGIAVCDSEEYFNSKVKADVTAWKNRYFPNQTEFQTVEKDINVSTIDSYIGSGYGKTYPEMLEVMRRLARSEGIALDPVYTGKAFYGLVSEIKSGRFKEMKDIVFVHTGGIYGLFPYRSEILAESCSS